MGMTMTEKILARASGRDSVSSGDYVTAVADMVLVGEGFGNTAEVLREAGITQLWDPARVIVNEDHSVPPPAIRNAENSKAHRIAVKEFGIVHDYKDRTGICHQILVENGHAMPGMLILGCDSHTTTCGAVGAAGCGFGFTEMAYLLKTGAIWLRVPSTIRFELEGRLSDAVMSKDIVLHIASKYADDGSQYKAIEFGGAVSRAMSLSSRMTMCNMGVDLGAKFALFEADDVTYEHLKDRVKDNSYHLARRFGPDDNAVYEKLIRVDVSKLEPQVACPHTLQNTKAVSDVRDVRVDQAFLGSCTNGRLEDIEVAVRILNGRKVHPDVRMIVLPASTEILLEAMRLGYINSLIQAGAIIGTPGCGPCGGTHQGILAGGERCIASSNRNPRGRMGSTESEVYLASPATVAASAVEGKIADPRNYLN